MKALELGRQEPVMIGALRRTLVRYIVLQDRETEGEDLRI